jgi:ABC-type branched-subunit amino acid transport system permease subunit
MNRSHIPTQARWWIPTVVTLLIMCGGVRPAAAQAVVHQSWAQSGTVGVAQPQDNEIYIGTAPVLGEQARAFLAFDSADQAAFAAATLELTEASDSAIAPASAPRLHVCTVSPAPSKDGKLDGAGPTADCTVSADLDPGNAGIWTLPLTLFATRLASGAGLVVLPGNPQPSDSYTIGFDTAKTTMLAEAPPQPTPSTASSSYPTPSPPSAAPHFPGGVALPPAHERPAAVAPPPAIASPTTLPAPPVRAAVLRAASSRTSTAATLLLVAGGVVACGWLLRRRDASESPVRAGTDPVRLVPLAAWSVGCYATVTVLGALFSQTTSLRLGLVGVSFVAAIGLHLLVNGAGELSLAHIGNVAVPLFAVAQVSSHTGISPVYCLPLAVLVGAGVGVALGLPALRARGVQVAVVTLGGAIAIINYLFNQSWFVGPPNGLSIPTPTLFGITLTTYRSLLLVIAAVVVIAGVAAHVILSSRIGRALSLVKANPAAASAAGIHVNRYRLLAFGLAGSFAGLAGGLYVVLVQAANPASFSLTDSFNYLAIAVLAGPGGLSGLVLSVLLLTGGQLFLSDINGTLDDIFKYLGPASLILNLAVYRRGFNGATHELRSLLERHAHRSTTAQQIPSVSRRSPMATNRRLPAAPSITLILAVLAIALGGTSIGLAWYHAGNTDQLWIQNQEIVSGGLGGLALIVVGCALLVRDALLRLQLATPQSTPAPSIPGEVSS